MPRPKYTIELPKDTTDPIYYIIFDEYLQPTKLNKQTKLQLLQKQTNTQNKPKQGKCTELPTNRARVNWKRCLKKTKSHPLLRKVQKFRKWPSMPRGLAACMKSLRNWRSLISRRELPNFLGFLRARNDDGLCKRKSGFEIYCELASVHGFKNFVGAQTRQRILWSIVVLIATVMSLAILVMSYGLNVDTPTILYTESTTYPAWTVPFPAVTLCNQNRISRQRVEKLSEKYALAPEQILHNLRHAFYTTLHTNATASDYRYLQLLLTSKNDSDTQLLQMLSPDCELELLRCKWKGVYRPCSELFRRLETPHGICCTFNYYADWTAQVPSSVEHTTSCGYKTGLTVLIEPHVEDYYGARHQLYGYEVYVHAATDYPMQDTMQHIVLAGTEALMNVVPHSTYPSDYLDNMNLACRRCYLPGEYKLKAFPVYSQANCLAECRSKLIYERCQCVPPLWPRASQWPICRLTQADCVVANSDIFSKLLKSRNADYKFNHYAEHFICDCFPACNFAQYEAQIDAAPMNRNFSAMDKQFFKDIKIRNQILLHVYFVDLSMERLRLDAYENWLSFIGTFGGIVGLHMGYSFISAFEMIFFVFIRPACNWLTMKKIRWNIKQRQKKKKAAEARAAAAEEEQKKRGKQGQQH